MKFEPICYDHAARLINRTPWEVSSNAELLTTAHLNAMKRYRLNGCVVGVDIYNVEAEAYGALAVDSGDSDVPSIGFPFIRDVEEILSLTIDPQKDGRLPLVFDAAMHIKAEQPDAEIRIPLSGPFTIACQLMGMENFICELFMNPELAVNAMMHLSANQLLIGTAAREAGFEISLFESSVTPPLLSPQMFSAYVAPALGKLVSELNYDSNASTQLIIGGDTVHIADVITSLKPDYIICPVETDQPAFMKRVEDKTASITVRINMNPAVFLSGNKVVALEEAQRVKELARQYSNTSTGTLIPFDADPAIIDAVAHFLAVATR